MGGELGGLAASEGGPAAAHRGWRAPLVSFTLRSRSHGASWSTLYAVCRGFAFGDPVTGPASRGSRNYRIRRQGQGFLDENMRKRLWLGFFQWAGEVSLDVAGCGTGRR